MYMHIQNIKNFIVNLYSYFNQTYIDKELIIVYDKNHPAINYIENLMVKILNYF